jgi:hypothetical protein
MSQEKSSIYRKNKKRFQTRIYELKHMHVSASISALLSSKSRARIYSEKNPPC